MKEMTRKEFLKLTGASTALLAMSHIIPTSAYAYFCPSPAFFFSAYRRYPAVRPENFRPHAVLFFFLQEKL